MVAVLSLALPGAGRPAVAGHGIVLDQEVDAAGKGYTILLLWGTDYQMGYAQAELLGEYLVQGAQEVESFLGALYPSVRSIMGQAVWMPPGLEDEFQGMVDALALSHPEAAIDVLDLKVASTVGEWFYGCRSHTCWGRYVEAPLRTLSTRRLDFPAVLQSMKHHVVCVHDPSDGSPRWVNLSWPGIVTAATGVNEFGTLVSLHDYACSTDFAVGRMPRMVACRYALSLATGADVSAHLDAVFAELQTYELMTGSFFNYYAPEGHGGVMVGHPYKTGTPDFHYLRRPQGSWHHGEAMITTNAWTDGTYTPADEDFGADAYYGDESPKTLESHWNLLAAGSNPLHLLSVAYRARGDMTVWADGRLDGANRTPRLEWEWDELFAAAGPASGDFDLDGDVDLADHARFAACLTGPAQGAAFETPWQKCLDAFDADEDADVDLADAAALQHLFTGELR